jgi:hypothetical protein
MEPTIVQNGALFALQHRRAKGHHRRFRDLAKVQPKRIFFRLPLDRINWLTSSFLIGTAALTLTALPPLPLVFRTGLVSGCSILCDAERYRI